MSNQSRYALLSTDFDSDDDDQNISVSEESDNSEENNVASQSNDMKTSSSNLNKLVYSVETLRSFNTSILQETNLDVIYTVETSSSRRQMYNKRKNNQNNYRKPNHRRFDNDDLPKQNTTEMKVEHSEHNEHVEPVEPHLDNESANNHLEQLLKESDEKLKKNERELEDVKIYDKGKNQNYSVTVGLNPEAILLQSAHNRNIEMTAGEMASLCSCPSILQEVQEEQKNESKPWKYVDIHGMHRGPYSSYEMRLLWEEGLITDNLLLRYNDNGWRPLYGYYVSQKDAFIEEPTKNIRNPIPKTVRILMKQKDMEPVKPVESVEPIEPVEPVEPVETMVPEKVEPVKQSEPRVETSRKSASKHSRGKPTPDLTSQLFSLRKGHESFPESSDSSSHQPASLPVIPPENAVSLNEALLLQTEEMEQEVKESTKASKKSVPLPQSNKEIPTLNLERDAPRIQNDTALFYVEEAAPKKIEPVKPKEPVISPWTKQRLDKKPTIDRSIDYSERIGRDIQPEEPVNVWEKKTRDLSTVNYSATVGIALPIEEEKKAWKPVAVQAAVPLEELLREEKEQQKQVENLLVPKEKGKKGKREWKPVDLSAKPTPARVGPTSSVNASVLAGRKSFKEILEEQEQEKKKETTLKAAPSKMNWGSIFSNNLPSLNSSKPTYQSKPAVSSTSSRVEEESFWDVAKRKVEEKENKKPIERKESKKNVNMITRDEFDSWCRKEMMKLSGSDDISLLDFCISLDDSQVLSYLQDYLGQSKEVTSFAKTFIQKKQHLVE